ncbi:MAG: hypothetical protein OHK006_19130 [Thermodesulfovibrionales bacterium]
MKMIRFMICMLFVFLPAGLYAEDGTPSQSIEVSFDIEKHTLSGVARIAAPAGTVAEVDIRGLGRVTASLNGSAMRLEPGAELIVFSPKDSSDRLEIRYETEFPGPAASRRSARHAPRVNRIGRDGIVLTGRWHPVFEGLMQCDLAATLPRGFEAVSEAEDMTVEELGDGRRVFRFRYPYPRRSAALVAAPYHVHRAQHRGVEISAYLSRDDRQRAAGSLEQAERLIDQYEAVLGKFPFRRFAVVETNEAAGRSGPTFALLPWSAMEAAAPAAGTLAHEILHQWFGGAVRVEARTGNWSEGLAVFLAEAYSGDPGSYGAEARKRAIAAFQAGVDDAKDFPLSAFAEETDLISGLIGYDKSAFVFHMLRQLVGAEAFERGLRTFTETMAHRDASWDDLQRAFESVSSRKLDWFFEQWVNGTGLPVIGITEPRVRYRGDRSLVSFLAVRQPAPYRMDLPVLVKTEQGEVRRTVALEKDSTLVEIEADGMPRELVVDGGVDLFRRLAPKELPTVIGRFFNAASRVWLLPKGAESAPADLADFFREEGIAARKEETLTSDELRSSSLLITDEGSDLARRLLGPLPHREGIFSATAREHPFSAAQAVLLVSASATDILGRYLPELPRYAAYGSVVVGGDGNVGTAISPSGSGISFSFGREVSGVEVPASVSLRDTVMKLADRDIIYVGELHDRFDHHRMQLEVIRLLHRKGVKIAIGMEMFQKPFQTALDDYVAGTIDEKTFLRKSEYFKRWGFDYGLYREILLYAREMKIPVVALNVRKEISTKVGREGLQSLTEKELEEIPRELDFTDREYRERLREIYSQHRGSDARGFDLFYQAQVLWDEAMALSVDEYLKKHPDTRMVVLAGSGHLAYGSGIPKRVHRRNARSYAVLINTEDVEKNIADYVFFPEPVPFDEAPRLMAQLKEENGSLSVVSFPPGSVSQQAGLKEEDVLLSLDSEKVATVEDIKILLLDRKKGDEVRVKVKRKRFLWGTTEMEFVVVL